MAWSRVRNASAQADSAFACSMVGSTPGVRPGAPPRRVTNSEASDLTSALPAGAWAARIVAAAAQIAASPAISVSRRFTIGLLLGDYVLELAARATVVTRAPGAPRAS